MSDNKNQSDEAQKPEQPLQGGKPSLKPKKRNEVVPKKGGKGGGGGWHDSDDEKFDSKPDKPKKP